MSTRHLTDRELLAKVHQFLRRPQSVGKCIPINIDQMNELLNEINQKLYTLPAEKEQADG